MHKLTENSCSYNHLHPSIGSNFQSNMVQKISPKLFCFFRWLFHKVASCVPEGMRNENVLISPYQPLVDMCSISLEIPASINRCNNAKWMSILWDIFRRAEIRIIAPGWHSRIQIALFDEFSMSFSVYLKIEILESFLKLILTVSLICILPFLTLLLVSTFTKKFEVGYNSVLRVQIGSSLDSMM